MPDEINPSPASPSGETLVIEAAPGSPQEQLTQGDNSAPVSDHPDTSGQLAENFKPINFSAFEQKRQGATPEIPQAKPVEAAKPQTPAPAQAAPEVPPVAKPATPPVSITRESVLKELGVPEDQFKNYKFMSNEAFTAITNVLGENKKLKAAQTTAAQPSAPQTIDYSKSLYGHSEGYLLDTNYRQAQRGVEICATAKDHWIAQAEAIERGEQWYQLSLDAQGNLVTNPNPIEPTAQAASHIRAELRKAEELHYRYSQDASNIQRTYGAKHKEDIALLKSAEEKFFPGYEKPDHATKAVQNHLLSLLPESQRANPLANMLAYTYANNTLLRDTAIKEKARADAAEAKLKGYEEKDKSLGNTQQPTKNNFIPGNGQAPKPTIDYNAFQRRLNGATA